jgi:uncharacterized protein YbdZ (MbtH family)
MVTIYKVVINHEEQYSIWLADHENPLGWRDVGSKIPNRTVGSILNKCERMCAH